MSLVPIVITPDGAGQFNVSLADGSNGMAWSGGLPVANAQSALDVVGHLLGITEITSPSEGPWRNTLDAMRERVT